MDMFICIPSLTLNGYALMSCYKRYMIDCYCQPFLESGILDGKELRTCR